MFTVYTYNVLIDVRGFVHTKGDQVDFRRFADCVSAIYTFGILIFGF